MSGTPFSVWVFGDAHVGTDRKHERESLATAIRQSERGDEQGAPAFNWDIAVDVGDMSGAQGIPDDEEGREVRRQLEELRDHSREAIYSVCGNHDRNAPGEPEARWWRRWIDPLGEHPETSGVDPAARPYPISGTWERYSFRVGNLLFLMMSDVNEPTQKHGRGELGGNPGGVVRRETFEWWRSAVAENPDSLIVTVHHYVLRDTTVASGRWEGVSRTPDGGWKSNYHGYKKLGTPQGASYLYWVGGVADSTAFQEVLDEYPGRVAFWLAGHTHTNPLDRAGGKSHVETRHGTHFVNAAALTRYHVANHAIPMSRLIEFIPGSNLARVRCYLHSDEFAPRGFYAPAERTLTLSRQFIPPSASE